MPDYKLKALTGSDVRNDRTGITLHLDTDKGPVNITMDATQLDHFATSMEGIEQQLTILDPVAGRAPGEAVQMRFYIVDGMDVGNVVVNNIASVAVVIKAGNTSRAYALDRQQAESLVRRVGDELPSLARLRANEQH